MPKHPSLAWLPNWMWKLNLKLMQPAAEFMTVALYDPPVRELMGYTWSPRKEWLHQRFCDVVTFFVTKVLPDRWLWHPPASVRRWTARSAGCPPDSPLVETPARNLPPQEYRGQPQFYCPNV